MGYLGTDREETALPLHERYPYARVRVVSRGKVSTVCLDWGLYAELLKRTPGRKPRVLAKLFRAEYERLEASGVERVTSADVRTALMSKLLTQQPAL